MCAACRTDRPGWVIRPLTPTRNAHAFFLLNSPSTVQAVIHHCVLLVAWGTGCSCYRDVLPVAPGTGCSLSLCFTRCPGYRVQGVLHRYVLHAARGTGCYLSLCLTRRQGYGRVCSRYALPVRHGGNGMFGCRGESDSCDTSIKYFPKSARPGEQAGQRNHQRRPRMTWQS